MSYRFLTKNPPARKAKGFSIIKKYNLLNDITAFSS